MIKINEINDTIKYLLRPFEYNGEYYISSTLLNLYKRLISKDKCEKEKDLDIEFQNDNLLEKQKETIKKALSMKSYAIFNDIGTGKTRCAIEIALYRLKQGEIDKVLIFLPLSLMSVWINELKVYGIEPIVIYGNKNKRLNNLKIWHKNKGFAITNYDSLLNTPFDFYVDAKTMLIFDESTKIKNVQAKRTKIALNLSLKTQYKLILTGSPFTNNLLEIWSQFFIVDPNAFNLPINFKKPHTIFYRFRKKFFAPDYMGWKWYPLENTEEFILRFISQRSTRYKREEFFDLPPKQYIPIYLDFLPKQKQIYDDIAKKLMTEIKTEKEIKRISVNTVLAKTMKLHQICGGVIYDESQRFYEIPTMKVEAVKDILEGLNEQVIIFTRFKSEIERLKKELKDYSIAVLTGDTDKEEEINKFKNNKAQILLATAETGGYGLSFQNASVVIYYSLSTKGEAIYQSEGRIYRLGTIKPVIYYYLLVNKSVDVSIYKLIQTKKELAEIDLKEFIFGNLDGG